jgi:hypothetical protein
VLVAQECPQRRDHQHRLRQDHRGHLVAGGLAKSGGQDHQHVAPGEGVLDHALLLRVQRVNPESARRRVDRTRQRGRRRAALRCLGRLRRVRPPPPPPRLATRAPATRAPAHSTIPCRRQPNAPRSAGARAPPRFAPRRGRHPGRPAGIAGPGCARSRPGARAARSMRSLPHRGRPSRPDLATSAQGWETLSTRDSSSRS